MVRPCPGGTNSHRGVQRGMVPVSLREVVLRLKKALDSGIEDGAPSKVVALNAPIRSPAVDANDVSRHEGPGCTRAPLGARRCRCRPGVG